MIQPNTESPYETKVIAFIDILGFSALVSELTTRPELHDQIQTALEYIKSYKEASGLEGTVYSDLKVNTFSDSIVISSEKNNFPYLIWACGWLQAALLEYGILLRGGISIGNLVHQDDILYGEGLIKAHEIESQAAIYPRIIVEPGTLNQLDQKTKSKYLSEDLDSLWLIDPFRFDAMASSADVLGSEGSDPREKYFEEVGKQIINGIKKAKKIGQKSKWEWLSKRYKKAYEEYLKNR